MNKKNISKTLGLSATLQNLPVKLTKRPFFKFKVPLPPIRRLKSDWERSVFVSKSTKFCFLYEICISYTKVMACNFFFFWKFGPKLLLHYVFILPKRRQINANFFTPSPREFMIGIYNIICLKYPLKKPKIKSCHKSSQAGKIQVKM